ADGQGRSLALEILSFFLVQANFVLIPAQCMHRAATPTGETLGGAPDGFGRAYHAAEQALERLTTKVAGKSLSSHTLRLAPVTSRKLFIFSGLDNTHATHYG